MPISCPRIVIAGTNSGVGKTSVTLAVVSALRKRGLRVQTFKVGPDYLDPTYLSMASGRPCYNLDGWMTNEDYVKRLFVDKASQSDISVIEGVMGLFDGSDAVGPEGSTAEIASWLDAPVVLVVNVHGLARSIAALVHGFTTFDSKVKISGAIANHCGSERHGMYLSESLNAFGLPKLLASIPRGSLPGLPSRHLGLVSADVSILNRQVLDTLGEAMERYCSISDILEIAGSAPHLPLDSSNSQQRTPEKSVRLGVAKDSAFHFYYQDNLEALSAAGCELVEFSPLRDDSLPSGLDGVYFGGGYPEEHADELSKNMSMLNSVRQFASTNRPIYAECGGLMYLSKGIESIAGEKFELVGLLPTWTRMLPRLKSLGYVEVTFYKDSLFGPEGRQIRGHEFHYSELIGDPLGDNQWTTAYRLRRRPTAIENFEGFQRGNMLASYVHGHFASRPDSVSHFVSVCKNVKRQEKLYEQNSR